MGETIYKIIPASPFSHNHEIFVEGRKLAQTIHKYTDYDRIETHDGKRFTISGYRPNYWMECAHGNEYMEIGEIKKDFPILRKRTLVLTRKLSEPIVFFIVWIVIMLGLQPDLDNLSLVNVNGG